MEAENTNIQNLENELSSQLESQESTPDTIPANSPTLLVDETTSRFSSAIWYNKIQEEDVLLAGVGGIGSYVGFLLGRLNISSLTIYDPDIVENVNLSGQLYKVSHVGEYKVTALSNTIANYGNYHNVLAFNSPFTRGESTRNVMICGFDNMAARKEFFEAWLGRVRVTPENKKDILLYIDGRLAAEEFQIFAIQGNDKRAIKEYQEKWLFDDSEAEETICSYKQTSFMANMIASYMVNIFVNFEANKCNPLIPRDIPFFTSYNASTMFTKIEM